MNLSDLAQQAQDKLDAQASMLTQRSADLDSREGDLEGRAAALDDREATIASRETDLDTREAAVKASETALQTADQLNARANQVAVNEASNRAYESQLADQLAVIKQREADVLAREQAVTDREANYKQTVKDEFFAELKRNLPQ